MSDSLVRASCCSVAALVLFACGDRAEPARPSAPAPAAAAPADHGQPFALGVATVGGRGFSIARLGELAPGVEGAFSAAAAAPLSAAEQTALSLYLWVEDAAGIQVSAPAKGTLEGEGWHFHVTPRADAAAPARVVLRLREGATDDRAGLPLDGHGHEHASTPHDGVVASWSAADGGARGMLELKLHDDKGDLELWLGRDATLAEPLDLPLDAVATVRFIDLGDRKVALAPRNRVQNEDETGAPNVRAGKTNYFVFPGATGADSTWLKGLEFASIAVVTFDLEGVTCTSDEFVLRPHGH